MATPFETRSSILLRINLVECLEKIGDLKFKAGDNTGALTAYEEMVAIDRGLVEIDGSNTQRQWNLSLSLDRIGDVELALGHTNAAASAYEESLALRRRLVEADTSNSRWQDGISSSLKKISNFKHVAEERAAKLAVQRELQDIDRLIIEFNQIDAELQRSPSATEGKETTNVATRSLATIEESLTVSRGLATSDPCPCRKLDPLTNEAELDDAAARWGYLQAALVRLGRAISVAVLRWKPKSSCFDTSSMFCDENLPSEWPLLTLTAWCLPGSIIWPRECSRL